MGELKVAAAPVAVTALGANSDAWWDWMARGVRSTGSGVDGPVRRKFVSWPMKLQYPEGRINALRSAARLIAAMPTDQVARQVTRLAGHLGLDHELVTEAVAAAIPDAVSSRGSRSRTGG